MNGVVSDEDIEDFNQEKLIKKLMGEVLEFNFIGSTGKAKAMAKSRTWTIDKIAEPAETEKEIETNIDSLLDGHLALLGITEEDSEWAIKMLKKSGLEKAKHWLKSENDLALPSL